MKNATLLVLALALAACGDITITTGEEGRLTYGLYTSYDVPEWDLSAAHIVTGHSQLITVSLTAAGRKDVADPGSIVHSVTPSAGVTLETVSNGADQPPDIRVLVDTAGSYVFESRTGTTLVDRVTLTFEAPSDFDLLPKVRAPWEEEFFSLSGEPITVEEGSQVVLLAVPLGAGGARLAGDMTTELSVAPKSSVVPGVGVIGNWEGAIATVSGEVNFYFIEPGTVAFTVTDPVSLATGTQTFTVTPVTP